MRIPNEVHEAHPWVIAGIAPDFVLLDVWALPVEGERDDFDAVVDMMSSLDPLRSGSLVARLLFWIRLRLGALLGWDDPTKQRPIPASRETALSQRLPADVRENARTAGETPTGVAGFTPLYRTCDEWAAEISNETVHGVLQLAWVERADGRYGARLAIYVKTRGTVGRVYVKLIEPFRHYIVYPALMKQIGRAWDTRPRRENRSGSVSNARTIVDPR